MDPVSLQTAQATLLRPTAVGDDLARVLQRGQVVAGEVLQSSDGGSVLLAIGRQRVAAQSQVRLEAGQRFLFEVVESSDGIALRIVDPTTEASESQLLRALRAAISGTQPIGELLEGLRVALGAVESAPQPGSPLALLADALARHVWNPSDGAATLAELLQRNGASYEAHLLDAALQNGSTRDLAKFVDALRAQLFSDVAVDAEGAVAHSPEEFFAKLGDALRGELARALGFDASTPRVEPDWTAVARDLKGWIGRALSALSASGKDPAVERALVRLRAVDFDSLTRGERGLLARALLGTALSIGDAHDPLRARVRLASVLADLKAELLRARESAPTGEVRTSVERTLSALESEQLFNLARAEGGEARHWSLPVADGARWATLDFSHRRVDEHHEGATNAEPAHRLSFAVDFSGTGPVRADLLARPGSLSVRVAVEREDVLERLRTDLGELETRLAVGARAVHISLVRAEPGEVSVRPSLADIRYLREHHVMDLQG
ncbi:MAG: flagellar hook-length control protein FliK [Planctomycetes bacterium]|nr:flagellar hook-length control protein FliK [Planctomycetota bacterium]